MSARIDDTETLLIKMFVERKAMGMSKYKTSVADNPLTLRQWLMHSLEEKMDDCVYMLRAIQEIDAKQDDFK
jgi:hypothetical protein